MPGRSVERTSHFHSETHNYIFRTHIICWSKALDQCTAYKRVPLYYDYICMIPSMCIDPFATVPKTKKKNDVKFRHKIILCVKIVP